MYIHRLRFAALLVPILGGLLTVACGAGTAPSAAARPATASVTNTAATQVPTHPAASPTSTRPSTDLSRVRSPSSTHMVTPPPPTAASTSDAAQSTAIPTSTPPSGSIATEPTSPARSGRATQACELVTEQDAQAALGSDPGTGIATDLSGGATACSYLAGKSTLQLSLTPSGGKAAFDQQLAGLPKNNPAVAVVTGIGDHAFTQAQGTRAAVNFDKGDALVVIGLNIAGATKPPLQQLDQLATTAATRL